TPPSRGSTSSSTATQTIPPTGGSPIARPRKRCSAAPAFPSRLIRRTRSTSAGSPNPPGAAVRSTPSEDKEHDRRRDDLKRTELQVPLGPGDRSGLEPVLGNGDP